MEKLQCDKCEKIFDLKDFKYGTIWIKIAVGFGMDYFSDGKTYHLCPECMQEIRKPLLELIGA